MFPEIYLDGKFVCKSDYQNAVFVPFIGTCLSNCEIKCRMGVCLRAITI